MTNFAAELEPDALPGKLVPGNVGFTEEMAPAEPEAKCPYSTAACPSIAEGAVSRKAITA